MIRIILFYEELTNKGISKFVNDVSKIALENFVDAFEIAKRK